ncbi:MAG: FHA domain-containing protein [Reyranella sp.]|uniref:FHA domain-containing protein n=1 Tax=Reyranella sp. TaxID=1929291 RepID=UPI003D118555
MGGETAALTGFFGLTSLFAVVAAAFAGWMAWRIVEKTGLPGWLGLGAMLLTLTGIGSIVPLVLLWIFAFMDWPRDGATGAAGQPPAPQPGGSPAPAPAAQPALAAPPAALADRRTWRLSGKVMGGGDIALVVSDGVPVYVLTGAAAAGPTELSLPDPSVGQPHARILTAAGRIGLEDLGTANGTLIDGARLLPEHGPRDISAARIIRIGSVDLVLSRA